MFGITNVVMNSQTKKILYPEDLEKNPNQYKLEDKVLENQSSQPSLKENEGNSL